MANAKTEIMSAIKDAMKNKDAQRRDTLRLINSAIKQVEVDERRELSEQEVIDILVKEAKKRRESIDELETAGGREEQVAQEKYELGVIEEFLPKQLTREEIETLARDAINETGAESPKDMGKVMGKLQPQVRGRADGKMVSTVVRELLSS